MQSFFAYNLSRDASIAPRIPPVTVSGETGPLPAVGRETGAFGLGIDASELGIVTSELGIVMSELGIVTSELGIVTSDFDTGA